MPTNILCFLIEAEKTFDKFKIFHDPKLLKFNYRRNIPQHNGCSASQSRLTLFYPMDCSMPGFPVHHQLLELCSNSYPLSRWCHATISSSVVPFPALNLSQHEDLFHWVGSLHQVAKVLKLSFSISPSNKYSELISFRIDWFDLLVLQGTLKSLLQHRSLKASVL